MCILCNTVYREDSIKAMMSASAQPLKKKTLLPVVLIKRENTHDCKSDSHASALIYTFTNNNY